MFSSIELTDLTKTVNLEGLTYEGSPLANLQRSAVLRKFEYEGGDITTLAVDFLLVELTENGVTLEDVIFHPIGVLEYVNTLGLPVYAFVVDGILELETNFSIKGG